MKYSTLSALVIVGLSAACTANDPPARPQSASTPLRVAPQQSEPVMTPAAAPLPQPALMSEAPKTETLEAAPLVLEQEDTPRTPDVVYVPTPQPVVDRMLELAEVKKTDLLYDLGCGDGRIVVTAAKRYGVRAHGFDIDPKRVAEARKNVKDNGVEHLVTIHQRDIFKLDLSPANVVTLYLLPQLNVKLIPQLQKLKPGSRVVSHDFDMEGVKPEKLEELEPPGEGDHSVFLWRAPIKRTAKAAAK